MTFLDLLDFAKEKDFLIIPSYVQWYDGELLESMDIEIVGNDLVLSGAPMGIGQIDVGVFENGVLVFSAQSVDGTEYLIHCCY